jgi:uncharacterized iron-regulated protein
MILAIAFAQATPQSPNELPIGRPGTWYAEPGRLVDLTTDEPATAQDVVAAAKGHRFVFLGEEHATTPHQAMHAEIIDALAAAGRDVVVGLEMLQRPKQEIIDQFLAGSMPESDFLNAVDWKGQWGYDYGYYRPIFDAVRRNHGRIIALNIPRTWVHTVATGGFEALAPTDRTQLPTQVDLDNSNHRKIFDSMMGGHPMAGVNMDHMYQAQVLWDVAMSDTVAKDIASHHPSRKTIYVVIAGAGHLMYGQGINWRLAQRKLGDGPTVVMMESSDPVKVSNGIGDFVYVTMPARQ